jgi:hypothetical protein
MEKSPFDGTVMRLENGANIFTKKAFPDESYIQDSKNLASLKYTKLTDNFISMQVATEDWWSWLSDSDWISAKQNIINFAKVAKIWGMKWFFLDPEPYGNNPWKYSSDLYPAPQTFASIQSKVRSRGAEFMSSIQDQIPDVKIMLLFWLTITQNQVEERDDKSLRDTDWALWSSFIDGMLDVIWPRVEIIDGNESSYYYTSRGEFDDFLSEKYRARSYISPENRSKYDTQVRTAQSIYVDGALDLWNTSKFIGHYITRKRDRYGWLEYTLYYALRTTDEYVWVYNENMDWWDTYGSGKVVPRWLEQSIRNMVRRVEKKWKSPAISWTTQAWVDTYKQKIFIGGTIRESSGASMTGGTLSTGKWSWWLGDIFCGSIELDGWFSCFFPRDTSFTITPSKLGYRFIPESMVFKNQPYWLDGQDFVAVRN